LQNGESCLHAAAVSGDAALVSLLLAAGADPDLAAMSGVLPVELAPPSAATSGGAPTAKSILAAVTTANRHSNGSYSSSSPVYRSLTPDKLSALRSGTSMLIR
jgi:ankyrin repeat protein